MALELQYYGSNVSLFGPDLALTGDPGIDIAALTAAGYVPGTLVKLVTSTNNPDGIAIAPADGAADDEIFGAIITIPGEFANSIGASGSNRITVARSLWVGNLYGSGYDTARTYVAGQALYAGTSSKLGLYTNADPGSSATKVGIVTHVPTTSEPWLGIASLI